MNCVRFVTHLTTIRLTGFERLKREEDRRYTAIMCLPTVHDVQLETRGSHYDWKRSVCKKHFVNPNPADTSYCCILVSRVDSVLIEPPVAGRLSIVSFFFQSLLSVFSLHPSSHESRCGLTSSSVHCLTLNTRSHFDFVFCFHNF